MSVLKMFGNWTFGTLVFTVMVITVTLKVNYTQSYALITNQFFFRMVLANIYIFYRTFITHILMPTVFLMTLKLTCYTFCHVLL